MDQALTRMSGLAPKTMRRMFQQKGAQSQASRAHHHFMYPHSHMGANNAYNNFPVNEKNADRPTEAGTEAPIARADTRAFPDWYKPYTFNYSGEGYLALFFGVFCIYGYSSLGDICEQKGRKSRKTFESPLETHGERARNSYMGRKQVAAGNADYEKFLHPKQRASVHHH